LQEQNEELHHSLLQATMGIERMGSEFRSNQQQLEAELQRSREELESLRDKFRRLQDSYSSSQQANHLLEQKLHSVVQSLEGEKDCLNQRISELTEQLLTAQKTICTLETINVRIPSLPM
ncbi:TJAP1 protein, partial [Amia calva]|nr:TJAP1 protein [Amia calva]